MEEEEELSIDSQAESAAGEQEPDVQLVDILGGKDYFLINLVHITNLSIERKLVPITLQMGGLLISGIMIAGDVYFKMLADVYFQDDPDSEVQRLIAECGDIYREERKNSSDTLRGPEYIHLKECVIVSNHIKSKYVTLWRGRISQIDGFFLGYLSLPPKPSNNSAMK